jgi:serine/threonine protein phosphatase PrpC
MEIAVLSKCGGRDYNEDACGYWTSDALCCWVVCDGAGGHGGGDVASKLAVSSILKDFSNGSGMSPAAIERALERANRSVMEHQGDERRLRHMHATATVLLVDPAARRALWGHVGDSRIYCFRGGRVIVQTRDHSVLQSVIDGGVMDPVVLRNHPQRNVLLHALGSEEEFRAEVTESPLALREGDTFLLCTDGFWEYVEEPVMERALVQSASPNDWIAAMEAELLRHVKPGHDNYSAIAVWLGDQRETTVIMG